MKGTNLSTFIRNAAALTIASFLLSACLMGEEESRSADLVVTDHDLTGSVGDGPVIGASIRVSRNDGVELAAVQSDSNANYNITVSTNMVFYPLSIDANNGTDIVTNAAPDFELLGAVLEPGTASVANLNPFTTFAVELARDMPGGINKANLESAQATVATEFNNGLDSVALSGAMTTRVDGSNIAEVVRASEALGEIVRRTRDALGASGFLTSGDNVVRTLSSDLTDNVVDGIGGPRADARYAAVSTIVAAQVLLETMANQLHVNGVDATQTLSNAIDQVSVETANPTLGDLSVTASMLLRARVGLAAAYAVSSDTGISDLLTAIDGVQAGASSSTVGNFVLPADYRSRLSNALLLVAGGSNAVLETVNDISRNRIQVIGGANRAPNLSGTPASSIRIGEAYSFTPGASDPDGDTLSFSISNMPAWASFDTVTGQLSGTPVSSDIGTYPNISIDASDGNLTSSLGPFSINVFDDNQAPVISGTPPANVTVGTAYDFTPTASDPDGDTLTFSVSAMPSWASFDTATGQLFGTPAAGDTGVHGGIVISVSDGALTANLATFSITVNAVVSNSPPVISGTPPANVTVGTAYDFTPTASDPDGDTLTFSVSAMPSWASFDTATGQLFGTPASGDTGVHGGIVISVSDGALTANLATFSITVNAVVSNSPPVISGTPPANVTVGTAYDFTPTASDPDGDTLTFSVSGLPSWASFDNATGQLSGTPASGDAGVHGGIVISVSDGALTANLATFSITVDAVVSNSPPVISGSAPASVNVDDNYSFTPTASDPDGDTLTFSVSGLPSWASFDTATGQISGTPQSGDVGTYSNISITVSDGQANASIGPFTITVQAVSLGSVTLTWTAPTENDDGSPLTDLDGYRIYWGTTPGTYPNSVTIDNESVTTYVVDNLAPGTYEFVAKAFNTSGIESVYSTPATAVVP